MYTQRYEAEVELLLFKQFDDFRWFLNDNKMLKTKNCLELFGARGVIEKRDTNFVDEDTTEAINEYVEQNFDVFSDMLPPEDLELTEEEKAELDYNSYY